MTEDDAGNAGRGGVSFDPVLFAGALEVLTNQVDEHAGLLEQIAEQLTAEAAGGPWCWRHLEPGAQAELLEKLREWVDWLIERYSVGTAPRSGSIAPCWYRHPIAVEELTALMVAWLAAFDARQRKPSDAPAGWHDRWLWPTLRRIEDLKVFARCKQGQHDDTSTPRPLTDDGFTTFLNETRGGPMDEDTGNTGDPDDVVDLVAANGDERAGDERLGAAGELTSAQVEDLVRQGRATRLLVDDPDGPVKVADRWWGVPAGSGGAFVVLDGERAAAVQGMAERLAHAGGERS